MTAFFRWLALMCAVCCSAPIQAGEFPEHPVRLIIPFPPGGASDFGGRIVAAGLAEMLGQQFVVDNRGGASGLIATEMAIRSQPDGYTLFLGNVNTMAINPHIQRMKVDPVKDLVAIAPVTSIPTVIVGHVGVTGNTLKEFIDHALRAKREVQYGTATLSSPGRFIMVAFLKSLGIRILEVPYNGAGPATTALLAGEMEILPVTVASIVGLVKAGKLKALAVTASSRVPLLPDMPTMPELGYPDIVMGQWNGVFGPPALPRSVISKLHKAVTSAMKQEQVIQRLNAAAAEAVFSHSPEEYAIFVRGENIRWAKIIRESGLAPM
ncbi:MAG TPA: tripartite tricarboxylate transporter substrate binding protein [Burkholderiales bacterium]|nr:tripartite tricarboxylate transporter substrate binding protein [Burkholderiales bacterium]